MKDYNIQLKVRNNHLLERMRERGHETSASLSRDSGINQSTIGDFLNLKMPPITKNGPLPVAKRLAQYFSCEVEDLFPVDHLYTPLAKNKAEMVVSIDDVKRITSDSGPDNVLAAIENSAMIEGLLDKLAPRPKQVLMLRMGIDTDPHTYRDVGKKMGFTAERARQIEQKAIRNLRHLCYKDDDFAGLKEHYKSEM